MEQAQHMASRFGLPPSFLASLPPQPSDAALMRAAADIYLPLALPPEAVTLVDSLPALKEAGEVLSKASMVGLDTEWRPSGNAKASLLQLATQDAAFLIDLDVLLNRTQGGDHEAALAAVDAALGPMLGSRECLKLGFEVVGDLAK